MPDPQGVFRYTCRPTGALGLWRPNIAIHIPPRWGYGSGKMPDLQMCTAPHHFTAFFASLNFSFANALHSFSFWFRKSGACHLARESSSASASVIGT